MAELFWNSGEREKIEGLDVLGIRQVDQDLERLWVSGITTISIRGRYLSMLPWLLQAFLQHELERGEDRATFESARLDAVLRRFEIVVFLSSFFGQRWGEDGETYGVLGSDLFSDLAKALEAEGVVDPEVGKGGASLGTYFRPCCSLGLLGDPPPGSPLPVGLTPRGDEVFRVREAAISRSPLREVILEGGSLSMEDLLEAGRHFSVNGIDSTPGEAEILRQGLLDPDERIDSRAYERFQQTIDWSLRQVNDLERASSDQLIRRAYDQMARSGGEDATDVELAWFEYELRRRVHFGLELLLKAFAETLDARIRSTPAGVWGEWRDDEAPLAEILEKRFTWKRLPATRPVASVVENLPFESLLDQSLPMAAARKLSARDRAAFALGLLLLCLKQSAAIRSLGLQGPSSALEKVAEISEQTKEESFETFVLRLLERCIIGEHVHNALRKMAAGGKCTLRFYPDGDRLCTTGTGVVAGRSGDRLGNVLGILADAGILDRWRRSSVRLNDRGRQLMAKRGLLA